MSKIHVLSLVAGLVLALGLLALADGDAGKSANAAGVVVVVDHNSNDKATAEFKFAHVPSIAKNDLGKKATFAIVDGTRDDAGGDLAKLNDGAGPTAEDQPAENFFFAGPGGRLKIDLGSVMAIGAINTYSWHPNSRGPQVYKLYAADGTDKAFNAAPKRDVDPTKAGWVLIASVDTRPANGADGGGQYGVNIANPNAPLGKFQYLLIDTVPTETNDDYGNTFYSEITITAPQ